MQNFGHFVSDFVLENHIPGEPVTPQLVSDFVLENHIPGNPVTPQGQLISEFIHT